MKIEQFQLALFFEVLRCVAAEFILRDYDIMNLPPRFVARNKFPA